VESTADPVKSLKLQFHFPQAVPQEISLSFTTSNTRYKLVYILYNQRDTTYTMFFIIIISAVHVSGGFSAHHQEPIKLHVQS